MDRLSLLIDILENENASSSDRDDAAMQLGVYDDRRALSTLLAVAQNPRTDISILDVCGESIAQIWLRKENFNIENYGKLTRLAKLAALEVIKLHQPKWVEDMNYDGE